MAPDEREPVQEETPQEPETENEKKEPEKQEPEKKETKPENTEPESPETFTLTREQMERMEQAAKQLETTKDQFVRLAAEYENFRKRTAREKETLYQDGKSDAIKAFLAVYDDLERAAGQEGDEDSPHKKGLELIFQKYRDILKNMGVMEMEALGKPFDPERHNAVMHVEDEKFGENEVSQVYQAGFMLGGKVIRHATVVVAN